MTHLTDKNQNTSSFLKGLLSLGLSFSLGLSAANAASLGVSPTMIDLSKGEKVSGLRVKNSDPETTVSVQARIMRWIQDESGERYEPAQGVVASPPVTKIKPESENLIRVVRTAKHPLKGEESYRLLVDELPDPNAQKEGTVSILIRHSVPVFFAHPKATAAQPQWRIERFTQEGKQGGIEGWRVVVRNEGDKRMRLAGLELQDEKGSRVAHKEGLVGYVLGHSGNSFFVPKDADAKLSTRNLRVIVKLESGEIQTELLPVAFAVN